MGWPSKRNGRAEADLEASEYPFEAGDHQDCKCRFMVRRCKSGLLSEIGRCPDNPGNQLDKSDRVLKLNISYARRSAISLRYAINSVSHGHT